MAAFLTECHVKGFACLQDVKCKLTPIHAFIGPNDSGKSTLLRAIEGGVSAKGGMTECTAVFADGSQLITRGTQVSYDNRTLGVLRPSASIAGRIAGGERSGLTQFVRFNADELRQASSLIPYGTELSLEGRGRNIAGLYDAVRDRSVDRFVAISTRVSELFPTVASLGLRATGKDQKVLTVTLNDEARTEVLSGGMSEGLLYYLGFAILSEVQRPKVFLVEEPENGLHPSRIADIVRMLRAIAEDPKNPVQVIMATHSPLVVNELRPDEVTVVTRDPVTGTHLTPIHATPNFEERSKVYALGELWLSYANGKDEKPLLEGTAP